MQNCIRLAAVLLAASLIGSSPNAGPTWTAQVVHLTDTGHKQLGIRPPKGAPHRPSIDVSYVSVSCHPGRLALDATVEYLTTRGEAELIRKVSTTGWRSSLDTSWTAEERVVGAEFDIRSSLSDSGKLETNWTIHLRTLDGSFRLKTKTSRGSGTSLPSTSPDRA